MRVTEKLKNDLITKTGKTVVSLANDLNMSRPHISNVLNGKIKLSIVLALKLEAMFNMDARELLVAQLDEHIAERRVRNAK